MFDNFRKFLVKESLKQIIQFVILFRMETPIYINTNLFRLVEVRYIIKLSTLTQKI